MSTWFVWYLPFSLFLNETEIHRSFIVIINSFENGDNFYFSLSTLIVRSDADTNRQDLPFFSVFGFMEDFDICLGFIFVLDSLLQKDHGF